jgi:hypothetical protein
MDGAVWLWELAEDRFAGALKTLDFHHARDHLWALAHELPGKDTPEAAAWVKPLLRSLQDGGEVRVVQRLEELLETQSGRTPQNQAAVAREVNYFVKHREHLHDQAMKDAATARSGAAPASPTCSASACSSKIMQAACPRVPLECRPRALTRRSTDNFRRHRVVRCGSTGACIPGLE